MTDDVREKVREAVETSALDCLAAKSTPERDAAIDGGTDEILAILPLGVKVRRKYEKCPTCSGSGLALNTAGEPDECPECGGNTVISMEQYNG